MSDLLAVLVDIATPGWWWALSIACGLMSYGIWMRTHDTLDLKLGSCAAIVILVIGPGMNEGRGFVVPPEPVKAAASPTPAPALSVEFDDIPRAMVVD